MIEIAELARSGEMPSHLPARLKRMGTMGAKQAPMAVYAKRQIEGAFIRSTVAIQMAPTMEPTQAIAKSLKVCLSLSPISRKTTMEEQKQPKTRAA